MKHSCLLLSLVLSCILSSLSSGAEQVFDIREEGAVGDGETLSTAAIQKTIDRCAAAGGGTVYFPRGTWLSGTIELRSHVALSLEAGSRLLGSPNLRDYPERISRVPTYTSKYTARSLIYAAGVEDVAIRGRGTIDGNAPRFPFSGRMRRPFGIRMIECRGVLVEGISLCRSAMWMQLYLACERVRIHGISVYNHVNINNDGLDIDGCRNVVVSDCIIDSDDDAIVLKSTGDRRCENVTITNCILSSHCAALKTGTESSGGFRNITISNCAVFAPAGTRLGKDPSLAIYRRGGTGIALGLYDGATLENVTVSNVTLDGVRTPISVHLVDRGRMYRDDLPKPAPGILRNVILSNIVATDARTGISVAGIPQRLIENVQMSNIHVTLAEGEGEEASGLNLHDVAGLKLRDVTIRADRSQLDNTASNVKRLLIDGLDVQLSGGARPAIKLRNCPGAVISNSGDIKMEREDATP